MAQQMEVPLQVQIPILLKVISFDRQLRVRAPQDVVIGVAMQSGNRASVTASDEVVRLLSEPGTNVDGIPVRVVVIDLDRQSTTGMLAHTRMTHLYVTPIRAVNIRELAQLARAARVTTMTGVAEHLDRGLSIGVGLRGGRPRILVNVSASRAEGADLSAELLKLAELVP